MMEGNMGKQWGYNPRYSTSYNKLPSHVKEQIAKNPDELAKYEVKSIDCKVQNLDSVVSAEKSLNALEVLGSQYRAFFEIQKNVKNA